MASVWDRDDTYVERDASELQLRKPGKSDTNVSNIFNIELNATQMHPRYRSPDDMMKRAVNAGFSGGEKKRNEILQMALLEPSLCVLDETDSGLDIDALRVVATGVQEVRKDRPEMGVVLITHYQRLLDEIRPDHVHILVGGRIVQSGGMELAEQLERDGYEAFRVPA